MVKLLILAAVVAAGIVATAQAWTCQTTCNRVGNQTYCTQNCW